MSDSIRLHAIFAALGHETRLALVDHMVNGDGERKTVNELADLCGISPPETSRSLKKLWEAGIVDRKRMAVPGKKGMVVLYSLSGETLQNSLCDVAHLFRLTPCASRA
ncbi:MAG: winged helix-turn-helix transcriptional regulator [Rhodospirillales bacterium]|nr:winged helix-turn-helix transcriptional regulator [Rhodospirillales bacterium]